MNVAINSAHRGERERERERVFVAQSRDLGNSNLAGPLVADLGKLKHLEYL